MTKIILSIFTAIIVIGIIAAGPISSNVEQTKYQIIESYGNIEIREYTPQIVAEALISGNRKDALKQGFRTIADYIFGNNQSANKIAMTEPVTQQTSTRIAMTAPVTQKIEGNKWLIRFIMPAEYNLESLPKPNNKDVIIKQIKSKKFATIRFSGISSDSNLAKNTEKLQNFTRKNQIQTISEPTYSFFNPPWTLPFLRRNEVMIEIITN